MILGGANLFLTIAILALAMALGAILALIVVELRGRPYRRYVAASREPVPPVHNDEEKKRRQDMVGRLMELYSGVHSADALSDFLNKELERRHEAWRVRIPLDGPGEIYDLDPV